MKQHILHEHNRQQGIALPTTMVILFLAAIAGLYAAKTSMTEQMVTADHYRSEQAFAMAQGGVDAALKKHNDYPVDDLGVAVTPDPMPSILSKGEYTVMFCDIWDEDGVGKSSALLMKEFLGDMLACTNPLTAEAEADGFANDTRVGILSVGKPDDASGRRTISLVSAPAFVTDGPPITLQPLVSKSFAAEGGTPQVINRYSNATIWAGNRVFDHGNVESFINDGLNPDTADRQDLISLEPSADDPNVYANSVKASGQSIGANSDILDNDYNLVTLTSEEMFEGFFAGTKSDIGGRVEKYTSFDGLDGQSGLIWVDPGEGNSLSGAGASPGTMGNCANAPELDPVMLIVDTRAGVLDITGSTVICGLVFVFGDVRVTGKPTISGALITTGAFTGAGTLTIVYDPEAMIEPREGFKGSRGVDAGTWKDWAVN